ncbi:MAG: NnrU family protein [Hyphomonadaceae bacterium]|nr:MAG: NnrU family protein [Hyphomonadaceae bacterium]KAF0184349.1 MAG: NnrU family protein [Hyphomonadaceae bacterium]
MEKLVLGLVIFLGGHLALRLTGLREKVEAKIGKMPFKGLFALVALVGFVLLIMGYAAYRPTAHDLYTAPSWGKYANYLLTLVSIILFLASYMAGKIKATLVHPQLAGVKAWALGHLLANGDAASVILFGSFLAWAIVTRILYGKATRENVAWNRRDEGAIAFGILVWVAIGYKLHPILFGASAF